ncbi:metallophosphoesterase [Thermanaerovibrio velox]|nr:metallophosphoesterase [Thermanaerovibrio velox]
MRAVESLRRDRLGHSLSALGAFLLLGLTLWAYRRWVYPFDGAVTAMIVLVPLAAFPFIRHLIRVPAGLSWLFRLFEEGSYLMVPLCFLWAVLVWVVLALRALWLPLVMLGLPPAWPFAFLRPPLDLWLSLVGAIGAVAFGLKEASSVQVRRFVIASPDIPRGLSLRVVQISDLHLGMVNDRPFVRRLVAAIKDLRPDMLVSTGDLLDGPAEGLEDVAEQLRSVAPPLGAFAVLGNHEHYAGDRMAEEFHRLCGFKVLRNEAVSSGPVVMAGVDDAPRASLSREDREGEDRFWEGLKRPEGAFVIGLKHRPALRRASAGKFHLMLCGHVHGGQIFPFSLLARSAYRHSMGLVGLKGPFRESLMYVSAGTGTWGAPVRLLAPPEVTVFDLIFGLELRGKEAE